MCVCTLTVPAYPSLAWSLTPPCPWQWLHPPKFGQKSNPSPVRGKIYPGMASRADRFGESPGKQSHHVPGTLSPSQGCLGFLCRAPGRRSRVGALPTGQPVSQPYARVRRPYHAPKHRHRLALHSCFEVLPGTVGHDCQQIRAIVLHRSPPPPFSPLIAPFCTQGT